MKLRHKFGIGFLAVVGLASLAAVITLSYESDCPPPGDGYSGANSMKAYRYHCYGGPEVLRLETVEKPEPADGELLVRVRAASVNPYDWHFLRGKPYFMRIVSGIGEPRDPRLGVDFAGTVEAVGGGVSNFKVGDEVFGGASGAFAEYVTISEDRGVALKPANVSFKEAATVGIAGITALQAVRDKGQLQPGQKVLINGASGGVGPFAVQIASAIGGEVTGVCSGRNVDMVSSIGADYVINYREQDFTELGKRYHLIVDNVGNHSLGDLRGVLEPEGTLVMVGTSNTGNFIGPLWRPVVARVMDIFVSQQLKGLLARLRQSDMITMAELMAAGEVRPQIDRVYTLEELPQAIEYSEGGSARAKIVIEVAPR